MSYQKLQTYKAAAVTPSDTADILHVETGDVQPCVLYIGVAGDLKGGSQIKYILYNILLFVYNIVQPVLTNKDVKLFDCCR